jgi:hypothetical protein
VLIPYSIVLAICKANIGARPKLFKTYNTDIALKNCCIWQVARATLAASTFFKSIQIGRDNINFVTATTVKQTLAVTRP